MAITFPANLQHRQNFATNLRRAPAGLDSASTCESQSAHAAADLHPGNILVAFDSPPVPLLSSAAYIVDRFKPFGWKVPSSWREPAIVLLDVGAFLFYDVVSLCCSWCRAAELASRASACSVFALLAGVVSGHSHNARFTVWTSTTEGSSFP